MPSTAICIGNALRLKSQQLTVNSDCPSRHGAVVALGSGDAMEMLELGSGSASALVGDWLWGGGTSMGCRALAG